MFRQNVAATYVLTNTEKTDVERIIRSKVPPYRLEAYEQFMAGCQMAGNELPSSIHKWRDEVKTVDLGVIRNLPIDALLQVTPIKRYDADNIPMFSDSVIGTISTLFGTIYSIKGKGMGRHISNMYPIIGDEYTQLGSSSKVELAWHVEEAFHPARPTWLSLLCLRGDTKAITKIARARDLQLPPDTLSTLREFRFKLRIDETYGDHTPSSYVSTSVLTGSSTEPEIVLDPAYTVFQDEIERDAVAAVESAAEQTCQQFTLMEGDLLIFNNRRAIHARSPFHPRMDGTDRWLKRAFILDASKWTSKLNNGIIPFEID